MLLKSWVLIKYITSIKIQKVKVKSLGARDGHLLTSFHRVTEMAVRLLPSRSQTA